MGLETINSVLANLNAFELPVPDVVMVLAVVVILAFANIANARRQAQIRQDVAEAYQDELVRANRKVHATEAQLTKVKSDLERERQRNRRAR